MNTGFNILHLSVEEQKKYLVEAMQEIDLRFGGTEKGDAMMKKIQDRYNELECQLNATA